MLWPDTYLQGVRLPSGMRSLNTSAVVGAENDFVVQNIELKKIAVAEKVHM